MTVVSLMPSFATPEGFRQTFVAQVRWRAVPEMEFELEVAPGGAVLSFRAMSPTGVTARRLREAPIGEMQRAVRERIVADARRWDVDSALANVVAAAEADGVDLEAYGGRAAAESNMRALLESVDASRRRRARDYSPDAPPGRRYAEVAAMYVDLLNAGESRPVVVLADRLGLGEKTVRNLLFKAREKDLLTGEGRGRAAGILTDKAKEILDGDR